MPSTINEWGTIITLVVVGALLMVMVVRAIFWPDHGDEGGRYR